MQYKLAVTVHRWLQHQAPRYLAKDCSSASEVPGRQRLRSARRRQCQLSIPRFRRSRFGSRAFSVAGPTVWNSLPDDMRDPAVHSEDIWRNWKHIFSLDITER